MSKEEAVPESDETDPALLARANVVWSDIDPSKSGDAPPAAPFKPLPAVDEAPPNVKYMDDWREKKPKKNS